MNGTLLSKTTHTTDNGTTITVTSAYIWGDCPQCGYVKKWGVYTAVEMDNPEWDTEELEASFIPVER